MNKQFLPYKEALALKNLGFNEPCFALYSEYDKKRVYDRCDIRVGNVISAPLYQQAFQWFREEHNLHHPIQRVVSSKGSETESISWTFLGTPWDAHKTYEKAQLECLRKLIETITNKEK